MIDIIYIYIYNIYDFASTVAIIEVHNIMCKMKTYQNDELIEKSGTSKQTTNITQ